MRQPTLRRAALGHQTSAVRHQLSAGFSRHQPLSAVISRHQPGRVAAADEMGEVGEAAEDENISIAAGAEIVEIGAAEGIDAISGNQKQSEGAALAWVARLTRLTFNGASGTHGAGHALYFAAGRFVQSRSLMRPCLRNEKDSEALRSTQKHSEAIQKQSSCLRLDATLARLTCHREHEKPSHTHL